MSVSSIYRKSANWFRIKQYMASDMTATMKGWQSSTITTYVSCSAHAVYRCVSAVKLGYFLHYNNCSTVWETYGTWSRKILLHFADCLWMSLHRCNGQSFVICTTSITPMLEWTQDPRRNRQCIAGRHSSWTVTVSRLLRKCFLSAAP